MTGEGFHSSPARDGTGAMVSDAVSAAADSNALGAVDFVSVRSIKSRSAARMSASRLSEHPLPGTSQGRHVGPLRKPYEYWTKLSNAKCLSRLSHSESFASNGTCPRRVLALTGPP